MSKVKDLIGKNKSNTNKKADNNKLAIGASPTIKLKPSESGLPDNTTTLNRLSEMMQKHGRGPDKARRKPRGLKLQGGY